MTYAEKLKDPRWQRKRLQVLSRDKFKCILCEDKKTELHVHHKSYDYKKEPWEYPLTNFQSLCKYCHKITEHLKGWAEFPVEVFKIETDNYMAIYVLMSETTCLRFVFDLNSDRFESGGVLTIQEFNLLRRKKAA